MVTVNLQQKKRGAQSAPRTPTERQECTAKPDKADQLKPAKQCIKLGSSLPDTPDACFDLHQLRNIYYMKLMLFKQRN